jgi:hypothetical protein
LLAVTAARAAACRTARLRPDFDFGGLLFAVSTETPLYVDIQGGVLRDYLDDI